jgi:hypothetical protein
MLLRLIPKLRGDRRTYGISVLNDNGSSITTILNTDYRNSGAFKDITAISHRLLSPMRTVEELFSRHFTYKFS